jgi:hypothetical protein
MKKLHSEFDFINRMYLDSMRLHRFCIVCNGLLEKGEYGVCSGCEDLVREIAPCMNSISSEYVSEMKLDTGLAFLALQEVLPTMDRGQHWMSWFCLRDALEDSRHYKILKEIRPAIRVKASVTSGMRYFGWLKKNGKTNTYYRMKGVLV